MNEQNAALALESLGNQTRLAIFRALVRAGAAGLPVGTLKEKLSIPGSTLSHHLSHLVGAGLLDQTREGRVLRCTANYRAMSELVGFLTAECCVEEDCGDEGGADC